MAQFFSKLFGNAAVKERLGAAIQSGTLPHALIISGPEGSGKRTLSRQIAAALLCTERGDALPCGICNNCRRVYEGIYPDLHIIAPEEGKTLIPVAKIREMRAEMSLSAVEGSYRIFIIEDAEGMNAAAQNALLISLEEPPEGVVILLLTKSEEALLTTVRSRAQTIRTELFDNERLSRYLTRNERYAAIANADPAKADALLESAHGCIGMAEALLSGGGLTDIMRQRELVDAVIVALCERDTVPLYDAIRALPSTKRDELADVLRLLGEALRDLILLKRTAEVHLLYYTDKEAAITLSERIGIRRLLSLSDTADEAVESLMRNANVSIVLATILNGALTH